ncbi:MAG: hypothetical protein ACTSRZ_06085 [Promethearchaeota archaeon]
MRQFFERTILGNSRRTKNLGCIVCHMQIFLDPNGEMNEMNTGRNYVKCPNDHYIHIEPCLINRLMQSNCCPVCNTEFNKYIMSQFEPKIVNLKKELEARLEHENKIQKLLNEIEEAKIQTQKKIIRELFIQAQQFINEKKYNAALNALFDIIDNYDPNNIDAKFLIGKTNYLKGKYDLAASNLMNVLKIQYNYPLVFYYLGKCYEELGLKEKQKWAFERAKNNLKEIIMNCRDDDSNMKELYQKLLSEVDSFLNEFS